MEDKDVQIMYSLENNYWFWLAKKNLLDKLIKKYSSNAKLALDIGCGSGVLIEILKNNNIKSYGVDVSKHAVNICKKKYDNNFKVANAEKLPFKDKFDLIIASDVLEHCNDKKAIKSISGALKRKGVVIVTVPMFKHLWGQDDTRLHHKRRYTKKQLKFLFRDFKILKMSYINSLLYLPAVLSRHYERISTTKSSGETEFKNKLLNKNKLSQLINSFFTYEQYIENNFVVSTGLPIGVGMVVVAQKTYQQIP